VSLPGAFQGGVGEGAHSHYSHELLASTQRMIGEGGKEGEGGNHAMIKKALLTVFAAIALLPIVSRLVRLLMKVSTFC